MKKLKIAIFKNGGGKLSFGGTPTKRGNITTLYRLAERKLGAFFRRQHDTKTAVRVDYGDRGHNESCNSLNLNYLLHCLVCFLEDHLKEKLVYGRKKKFMKGNIEP